MQLQLEKSFIVTDTDEESCFFNEQGEIIRIIPDPDNEVIVRFPKESAMAYLLPWEEEPYVDISYKGDEIHYLRTDDDWSPCLIAKMLFPGTHHSVHILKEPFSLENDCMANDCPDKATTRIMFNFYGSACQADVCEKHSKYHGMFGTFPWRE